MIGLHSALNARLREQCWLQHRQAGRRWRIGWWAACSVALTAGILFGWVEASGFGWIERCLQWPLLCVGVGAGMGWLWMQRRLQAAWHAWRAGWWAAQPLPAGVHGIAMGLLAMLLALPLMAGLALPLAAVAWRHPQSASRWLLALLLLGIVIGSVASIGMALRPASTRPRSGLIPRRTPVFGIGWLQGARPSLPAVLHWQQREAMQHWRTGHAAAWIVLPLLAMPGSTPPGTLIGAMLGLGSAIWCAGGLRAAWQTRQALTRLLAATPCDPVRIRAAAWRYPLFVALAGVAMAGLACWLADVSFVWLAAWMALALLAAVGG